MGKIEKRSEAFSIISVSVFFVLPYLDVFLHVLLSGPRKAKNNYDDAYLGLCFNISGRMWHSAEVEVDCEDLLSWGSLTEWLSNGSPQKTLKKLRW